MTGRFPVRYYTFDTSAKAGITYERSPGVVVFEHGEYNKGININTVPSKTWATTLELKVCLVCAENCQLGEYLHTSSVKIIYNNVFPSNKFTAEMGATTHTIWT